MIKEFPTYNQYVPFPKLESEADFMSNFYDPFVSSNPDNSMYAIWDKTTPVGEGKSEENYAGTISLVSTNPTNAATEIGIGIFPPYHRTHVTTNAVGILLQWILDPPSAGGLGLRRVEWQTQSDNLPSRKAAERMGFELEGIARWQRVVPPGNIGLPVEALEKRNGTTGEAKGRHTAIYSIVWDEWDEKRPHVIAQMERKN
jgi:RimJ/RimL family protein N-acetyltransferase